MDTQTERLNARDLITIGVFNALILVVYSVLEAIIQPIPGMGLFNAGLAGFLMAPLYLLLAARVKKVGVFTITSVLYAGFVALVGMYTAIIPVLIGGVLADMVGRMKKFRTSGILIVAYTVYITLQAVGNYSIAVINPQRFAARLDPVAREKFMEGVNLFNAWIGTAVLVLAVIGSIAGGILATRMLRRHFVKAGLIAA